MNTSVLNRLLHKRAHIGFAREVLMRKIEGMLRDDTVLRKEGSSHEEGAGG
jgi:hypothetical protein